MNREQLELLSGISDVDATRELIAELHDDLTGEIRRFCQLADLSTSLGSMGTLMPGGETALATWEEARSSFVHGNYVATVMLCQGLAEHMLAAYLTLGIEGEALPRRVTFTETLKRCLARQLLTNSDADNLRRLMDLRNPLSHFRTMNDSSNLSRRILNCMIPAEAHLLSDATFAISTATRLLALPLFRLGE